MKKTFEKVLTLCLALSMVFALAACGDGKANNPSNSSNPNSGPNDVNTPPTGGDEVKDWTGFHGWLDEDFDAKEVSYQFTGYWDMGDPEYGIAYSFLMNLYKDGSVMVNQYQNGRGDFRYFGSWELVEDPDGDELNINIVEETGLGEGELVDHRYPYTVYEELDGSFSFDFDLAISPGQYFRVVSLTGSKEIKYTYQSFLDAADAGAFVPTSDAPTDPNEGNSADEKTGYTTTVWLGDNDMTATLTLDDDTNATFVAAVTFSCTYTKIGSAVVLTPANEIQGYQEQIWPSVSHVYMLNDAEMTMTGVLNAYDADGLAFILVDEETMRVEFPQYSLARDGFGYTLSEDGTALTVTSTPSADAMGAFQQIWDTMGGENWTINGNTAAKAE